MQFKAVTGSAAPKRSECAVLGVFEGHELTAATRAFDQRHGRRIAALLRRGDFPARLGDTFLLSDVGEGQTRALLVGLGARKNYNRKAYRRALQAALQTLARTGVKHALVWLAHETVPGVDPYYAGRFAAEAAANVLYRIPDLKTGARPAPPPLSGLTLVVADAAAARAAQQGLGDGAAIADGMKVTRDLANLPANVCTPRHLGRAARALGKKYRALKVKVLERRAIEKVAHGRVPFRHPRQR